MKGYRSDWHLTLGCLEGKLMKHLPQKNIMGMIYSIRFGPPSCTCDPQDESNWEKKETRSPIDGTVEKTEFVCNVCGNTWLWLTPSNNGPNGMRFL